MATEWAQIFRFKSETIIEARHASKIYQRLGTTIAAVQEATLKIRKGTLTVIVGPSASGKTTFLHMLAGLTKPSQGTILFKGLDLSEAEEVILKLLREEYISVVFQEQSLIRYLTAKENVELPLELMGVRKTDRSKTSSQALRLLGMDNRQNHLVEELSGGERQKVNLARALAKKPELVLADEPTANLDTDNSHRIMEIIQRHIEEEGTTFVVATHDPVIAEKANLVLEMRDGRITLPDKYTLDMIELIPLRYMNANLFNILTEEIQTELVMQSLSEGDTTTIIGTPFRVHKAIRFNGKAEGGRGVITHSTKLVLRPSDKKQATPKNMVSSSEGELKRTGHLTPLYLALSLIAFGPSGFLIFLALAIWIRLGMWTSLSTASLIIASFLSLQALLLHPSKSTTLSIPFGRLCRVCGIRQSAQVCHQCGRKICPECQGNLLREPPFCSECITCHICGRGIIDSQCLICGNYVCSYCHQDGFCIECLPTNHIAAKHPSGKLRTLVLEPEEDIANDTCRKLGKHLHQDLHDTYTKRGAKILGLGMVYEVVASLPTSGGVVTQSTHINVVNRTERDAALRQLREDSDFPTCYYETCDYMIKRYCWICGRAACPNHSTICRKCGNIVCHDHHTDQVCTTCLEGPRKIGAKEILTTLIKLALPQFIVIFFLIILLGRRQLANIHPLLPTTFLVILLSVPIPYLLYTLIHQRKNTKT